MSRDVTSQNAAAAPVSFTLLGTHGAARRGRLHTLHGDVETPVFMPVGTMAAVKGLDAEDMHGLGAQMMLCNAYHLMLRPGDAQVAARGGLHQFMGYKGAVLTDSGGFQVFSLAKTRRVDDHGVTFRSHIDGAAISLTAERLVQVQEHLRPDVAMVLDECPPAQASRDVVVAAMRRTTAWAKRAIAARTCADVGWFGIVQGALHEDLRAEHAAVISEMPFAGVAIGGVSVGEAPADIDRIVRYTAPLLPVHKPRYLMGVGTPEDLVRGVAAGVDMFDCVMPSRNARNGSLFTATGRLSIKNAHCRDSDAPICAACACPVCKRYSRAYLRHLFVARELTYFRLATIHNLAFYLDLMARMRQAIAAGTFDEAKFLEPLTGVAPPQP
jgi:queuine tRNA-ribosyltransferase